MLRYSARFMPHMEMILAHPDAATVAVRGTLDVILRVFLPFACGYFLSYLFRTVNAVIAPDLVQAVGLSAVDLGLLTLGSYVGTGGPGLLLVFATCAHDAVVRRGTS